MDPITPQEARANEDAWLLGRLRLWSFTPPERERLIEIGDALREKPTLARRERETFAELDAFWERDRQQFEACVGHKPF